MYAKTRLAPLQVNKPSKSSEVAPSDFTCLYAKSNFMTKICLVFAHMVNILTEHHSEKNLVQCSYV
jgi:hypothetical protein